MIHEFRQPIPVTTPLGDGYAIYVTSNGMMENDEICVALCDGGQWRHFNTGQIRSYHNETYGITKTTPAAMPERPGSGLADQVEAVLGRSRPGGRQEPDHPLQEDSLQR